MDEVSFTNHGQVNLRNMHYWSVENPRWLTEVDKQRPWTVNVWCGIVHNTIIGPYFIQGTLTGQKYTTFLSQILLGLLEDIPLNIRECMWLQHDGFPAHYSRSARKVLHINFPRR
jgi:hypothetical protein